MAFTLPDFNLNVDIYRGPWLTKSGTPDVTAVGNLTWSRRQQSQLDYDTTPSDATSQMPMTLLLPALTDIRDGSTSSPSEGDVVEVPSGSGRWYGVIYVDDIGKGFANEHRAAIIVKIYDRIAPTQFPGLLWPAPIP